MKNPETINDSIIEKFKRQLENLGKLNLPKDQFVIVSSGALAIRGIREAKDIDIIVTQALWEKLKEDHEVGLKDWKVENITLPNDIEILNPSQSIFGNSKVVPAEEVFDQADEFEGIKFINLDHLKKIKTKLGREKDLEDVESIDNYLSKNSPE